MSGEWTEVETKWLNGTLASLRENANYWRLVALYLAGGDTEAMRRADDFICGAFMAAGRDAIGPRLPPQPNGSETSNAR